MSLIAMEFYGHPEEKLKIIAFTGTKGKTNCGLLYIQHFETKPQTSYVFNNEHNA